MFTKILYFSFIIIYSDLCQLKLQAHRCVKVLKPLTFFCWHISSCKVKMSVKRIHYIHSCNFVSKFEYFGFVNGYTYRPIFNTMIDRFWFSTSSVSRSNTFGFFIEKKNILTISMWGTSNGRTLYKLQKHLITNLHSVNTMI